MFNPDETPQYDKFIKEHGHAGPHGSFQTIILFEKLFRKIEQDARILEEKLRIALEFIERDCHALDGILCTLRDATLEKIEEVGK